MNKQELFKMASDFACSSPGNYITKENAISEELVGMKIYEAPILSIAAANDENFSLLKKNDAMKEHFLLPAEWLPQARSVISFFLPFTKRVIDSNAKDMSSPSNEWLNARYEGQMFLDELSRHLASEITKSGYRAVAPSLDGRFKLKNLVSNWSERHIAFICGLGTFGLSKGLITKKGTAGRFGSIVTDFEFEPDSKEYSEPFEYCTSCGACAKNCPVNAISLKTGKDHKICEEFLEKIREKHNPRYGCGKCQVKVSCEHCLPSS